MLPLFVLGLLALGLLAGVATVLARTVTRSQAHAAPRVVAAVLSVAGLGAVGLLGLGILGLSVVLFVGTVFVEHGPIRSIEVLRTEEPWEGLSSSLEHEAATVFAAERGHDPRWPLHLVVDWAGRVEPRQVERFLRRELDWDVELVDARRVRVDGEDLTRLDFGIELSRDDLDELELAVQGFGDLQRRVHLELDSR
jgi:hypothetical protein